jgi:hypothetical protein
VLVLGAGDRLGCDGIRVVGTSVGAVLGIVGNRETVLGFFAAPLAIISAMTSPTTSSTAAPVSNHSQRGDRGGPGGPLSPPPMAPPDGG